MTYISQINQRARKKQTDKDDKLMKKYPKDFDKMNSDASKSKSLRRWIK